MRINILDQDVYWRTADGVKIPLERMDHSHQKNVLAMLRRRADYNQMLYHLAELQDFSDAPDDVADDLIRGQLNDDPEEWLERRPLIIKLRQLVEHGDAIDAEVVVNELPVGK